MLTSGTASSWILPEIEQGYFSLAEIEFDPSQNIAPYLTFDDKTLEVSFNGKTNSSSAKSSVSIVQYHLIDTEGNISSYA